jgi:hypothetical protein
LGANSSSLFYVEIKLETCKVYLARTRNIIWSVLDLRGKGLTLLLAITLMRMIVTGAGAQQATVGLVPASYTVPNVGLTFSLNVTVQGVENLYGYEFKLFYPNDILNGTNVTQGPFLKTGRVSTVFYTFNFTDHYSATCGILNILSLRTGNTPGVNGNGTLVTITFTSTSTSGPETLHLADVKLSDPDNVAIPFTVVDGEVTVVPEFPAVVAALPLLMVLSLIAITLGRRIRNHRGNFHRV